MIVPRHRLLAWVAIVVIPGATLAGALPEAVPVALAGILILVAITTLDALLSRRTLEEVTVSSPSILRTSLGRQAGLPLELRDPDPRRPLRLAPELPADLSPESPTLEVTLPSVDGGRFAFPLKGRRRGLYSLERCRLERSSGLGFWNVRQTKRLAAEIRVYPDLREERRHLASMFLTRGGLGVHAHRQVGRGREFEKLREYLPGDAMSDVHWKASAKRDTLVTKEYRLERTQEVYILLDASRLSARPHGGRPALERTLRAALVLALATRSFGDLVGLLTFSDRVQSFLPARGGKAQFDACREALFTLRSEAVSPDFSEIASFLRLRVRRRALLVFLTDLDDPALAEDFVRAAELLGRRHLLLACSLAPVGAEPLFSRPAGQRDEIVEHLAGHLTWHRLRELSRVLRRLGADLALLPHADLSAEVVGRYVSIKQRQLL